MTYTCGISACLLGRMVRYDGGHRLSSWTSGRLAADIEWFVVCPEVGAGYGVPREPINVVGGDRLVTVDTKRDLTSGMERWLATTILEVRDAKVAGFILKARSPSCGRDNVEVFTDPAMTDLLTTEGDGLFVRALKASFPGMPLANEEELEGAEARERFAARVRAYARERTGSS